MYDAPLRLVQIKFLGNFSVKIRPTKRLHSHQPTADVAAAVGRPIAAGRTAALGLYVGLVVD